MDTFPLGSILLWIYIPIQVLAVHEYTKCSNASVSENLPVATFCINSEAEGVRIVLDGYFANAIPDKVCSCVAQRGQAQKIVFSNVNFLPSPIQGGAWCGSKIIAKQDNGESNHMSCRVLGSLNLQDDNDIQISLRKESEPEDTSYCALVYYDTDEPIKISCFSNFIKTTSGDESSIISKTTPSTLISSYSAETTTVDMLKETSTALSSQHETVSNSILMDTITSPIPTTHMDTHTATTILLTEKATVEMETTGTTISVDASTKETTTLTDVQSGTTSSTLKALQTISSKTIDMVTTTEPGTSSEMSIQMTEMTSVQSTPFNVGYKSSTEISKSPSTGSTPGKTTESLTTQYSFSTNPNTITPTESEVSTHVSLDITRNTTNHPNVSITTDTGTAESSTSAVTESTYTKTPYTHLFSVTTELTEATGTHMLFETTTAESTSMKEAFDTTLSTLELSPSTTTNIITVAKTTHKSTDSIVEVTVSRVEGLGTTDPSKTESSFKTSLTTHDSTMITRSTTKIKTTVPPEPTTTLVNEQTVDDKNLYIGIGVGCGALVIIIIILIGASIQKKHLTNKGIELKSYLHGEDNEYTTVNVTNTSAINQRNGINYTNGQADMSSKHKHDFTERDEYKTSAAKHTDDIPNIKRVDSLYAVVDKSKKNQPTDSVIGGVKDLSAAEKTVKLSQEAETIPPDTSNNGLQYAELEFSYHPSTTDKPNVTNNDSVDYAEVMFKNLSEKKITFKFDE